MGDGPPAGCSNPVPVQEKTFTAELCSATPPHPPAKEVSQQRYLFLLNPSLRCYFFFSFTLHKRKSLQTCSNLLWLLQKVDTSDPNPHLQGASQQKNPFLLLCFAPKGTSQQRLFLPTKIFTQNSSKKKIYLGRRIPGEWPPLPAWRRTAAN